MPASVPVLFAVFTVGLILLSLYPPHAIGDHSVKVATVLFILEVFVGLFYWTLITPALNFLHKTNWKYLFPCILLLAFPLLTVNLLASMSSWCCVQPQDFDIMCSLSDKVVNLLEDNKIPYFICFGSLLGAVREADMPYQAVPWEHDFDICVYESDWPQIHAALSKTNILYDPQTKLLSEPGFRSKLARLYLDIFLVGYSEDKFVPCDTRNLHS